LLVNEHDASVALADVLIRQIGEPSYRLWFGRHTKFSCNDGAVVVGVPNRFLLEFLQHKFDEAVQLAAREVHGSPVIVRFEIDPALFQAARQAQATANGSQLATASPVASTTATTETAPASKPVPKRPPKRHWRRLHDFVPGPGTRVGLASALAVVEEPGQSANPLVLHGPVGTGKTHLLEGIYAGLRQSGPNHDVCFLTAEDFTNRFVQSMQLKKLGSLRRRLRACDVLLIDDLHFLAAKKATQQEFLHTFDALLAEGKQIVVTCDCHPKLASELTPELVDRLVGGAVWGLTPPDAETRLALLRHKSAKLGLPANDDVLLHLAAQLRGNVREIEGALHSLRHYSRVANRPVDLQLTREALGDLLRHAVRVVNLVEIDNAVCQALQLDKGSLQSKQRNWAVSHPRMLAIYLARKHTASSYGEIGCYFGGRNHSTAVAAEKKVRGWLSKNEELAAGERRWRARDLVDFVERTLLG
jgi:chromosomal replication initiator protein